MKFELTGSKIGFVDKKDSVIIFIGELDVPVLDVILDERSSLDKRVNLN